MPIDFNTFLITKTELPQTTPLSPLSPDRITPFASSIFKTAFLSNTPTTTTPKDGQPDLQFRPQKERLAKYEKLIQKLNQTSDKNRSELINQLETLFALEARYAAQGNDTDPERLTLTRLEALASKMQGHINHEDPASGLLKTHFITLIQQEYNNHERRMMSHLAEKCYNHIQDIDTTQAALLGNPKLLNEVEIIKQLRAMRENDTQYRYNPALINFAKKEVIQRIFDKAQETFVKRPSRGYPLPQPVDLSKCSSPPPVSSDSHSSDSTWRTIDQDNAANSIIPPMDEPAITPSSQISSSKEQLLAGLVAIILSTDKKLRALKQDHSATIPPVMPKIATREQQEKERVLMQANLQKQPAERAAELMALKEAKPVTSQTQSLQPKQVRTSTDLDTSNVPFSPPIESSIIEEVQTAYTATRTQSTDTLDASQPKFNPATIASAQLLAQANGWLTQITTFFNELTKDTMEAIKNAQSGTSKQFWITHLETTLLEIRKEREKDKKSALRLPFQDKDKKTLFACIRISHPDSWSAFEDSQQQFEKAEQERRLILETLKQKIERGQRNRDNRSKIRSSLPPSSLRTKSSATVGQKPREGNEDIA